MSGLVSFILCSKVGEVLELYLPACQRSPLKNDQKKGDVISGLVGSFSILFRIESSELYGESTVSFSLVEVLLFLRILCFS